MIWQTIVVYCTADSSLVIKQTNEHTTPIFIKGLRGSKELQTTDFCVE